MAVISPQTLKHYVQRHALNVTSERSDHFLLVRDTLCFCVQVGFGGLFNLCDCQVFFGQTYQDKSDVLLLPRGWVFSASSENKASLCPCWVREFQGRLPPQLPQIQAPSAGLGNPGHLFHLLLSGKPMFCGFCLGCQGYIQTTAFSFFLKGVVRTRISTTRMSGQGVKIGNGQSSFWHLFTLWLT